MFKKKIKTNETNVIKTKQINSNNWSVNQQRLYYLVLTGFFIGLTMLSAYLSSFLKLPFLSGYSIPFDLVIYVYAIIFLKKMYFKIFYFVLTPLMMLLIPGSYINVLQTFFEYVLVYYCWIPFLFISFYNPEKDKKRKIKTFGLFVLYFLICVSMKFFIHIVSGVIWWTPTNDAIFGNLTNIKNITYQSWLTSISINAPYVYIGMLFYMPIVFILFFPLYSVYNNLKF